MYLRWQANAEICGALYELNGCDILAASATLTCYAQEHDMLFNLPDAAIAINAAEDDDNVDWPDAEQIAEMEQQEALLSDFNDDGIGGTCVCKY